MKFAKIYQKLLEYIKRKSTVERTYSDEEWVDFLRDKNHVQWILNHVYLTTENNFEALKSHPDWDVEPERTAIYFPTKKIPQKVIVKQRIKGNKKRLKLNLEKTLKLELHRRNCNAGIDYKIHEENSQINASAIPVKITEWI